MADNELSSANSEDSWANELLNQEWGTVTNTDYQGVGKIIADGGSLFGNDSADMATTFDTTNISQSNLILDNISNSKNNIFQNEKEDETSLITKMYASDDVYDLDNPNSADPLNEMRIDLNRINQSTFLLDKDNIPKLPPKEKEIANKIYEVLKWSWIDSHKAFSKNPKDSVEVGSWSTDIQEALGSLGKIYTEGKTDVFKPSRLIHYKGKEYEFAKFSGRYFTFIKYKWSDFNRCRGAVKMTAIDPLKNVEMIIPHSQDCRSNWFGWKSEDTPITYETQEKFNYIVDYEIAQATNNTEHANSILKRLELRAKDMANESGTHVFPPDRMHFMQILKRERKSKNPKANLDKLLFSPELSQTKKKERFLRFSFNVVDNSGIMQQCILWASEKQIAYMKTSPQVFVSLWYQGVPTCFQTFITIIAFSTKVKKFIPCWFALASSDCWSDMFTQMFQYLKDEWGFEPNIINLPLHDQLYDALKKVYPDTILLGCYRNLVKKLYDFYSMSRELAKIRIQDIQKGFFGRLRKAFFRFSNMKKSFNWIMKAMKQKADDERYQELFSELQGICHKFSELLDYTIIKRVTVKPVEQFFQNYILKDLGKLKHISFTIFISKLIDVEDLFISEIENDEFNDTLNIEADENEETLDVTDLKTFWDKENEANSEAAQERLTSVLVDSDIELDCPPKTIKPSVGYPLATRSNNIDYNSEYYNPNEKSLKQLAFENLGIKTDECEYPVGPDGKIFTIIKTKRRKLSHHNDI
jgi:hypothetical protein